jgi:hypothetical protein
VTGLPDVNWLTPEEAAGAPIGIVFSPRALPVHRVRRTYEPESSSCARTRGTGTRARCFIANGS